MAAFQNPSDPVEHELVEPEPLHKRLPKWSTVCEASVFLLFTVFFLLYGVTPLLGGDGLGLVGADEPRYAQVAHEMLGRFDAAHTIKERLSACVTPFLYGQPWLEKPALYYWRAMFIFQEFGVHDWSARLPSVSFAFIMGALIYLHQTSKGFSVEKLAERTALTFHREKRLPALPERLIVMWLQVGRPPVTEL